MIKILIFAIVLVLGTNPVKAQSLKADVIITNIKVTTLDDSLPEASAVAIKDGKFIAVGGPEVLQYQGPRTKTVDGHQRRMIPGLNDVHMHLISYGATFNREIRWDGLKTLAEGLSNIQKQALRIPEGEFVRVLGGWSPYQFKERRLPTPADLNRVAPHTPVIVTHLWDRIILNKAGLKSLHITRNTPNPKGGRIEKDKFGFPTGVIIATKDWGVILNIIAKLPPPHDIDERKSSTQQFMNVLNQFGVTSVIDGGAGAYPANYDAIMSLRKENKMTLRVAGTLYPPMNASEPAIFQKWLNTVDVSSQDPFLKIIGAGEIVSYASFDMTNFEQDRPDLKNLEETLTPVLQAIIEKGWFFRLHAAYEQTISRILTVIEHISEKTPIRQRWSIEHAETLSDESIRRIKKLNGGVTMQSRLLFQGEEFLHRYGKEKAMQEVTPIRKLLNSGIHVGLGTDAMRIASFNPWLTVQFFVEGKTLSGLVFLPKEKRISRLEALKLITIGSAWFSNDEEKKGRIKAGQLADFSLLSEDYFMVPASAIGNIRSVLTVVDGKIVYADKAFKDLAPLPLKIIPAW